MKKAFLWGGLFLLIFSFAAYATPKNVIIIRHGEKSPGENHINVKGSERAAALAYYFSGTPLYNDPPPTYIFAAATSTDYPSIRPIQTCTPTADFYGLALNIDFYPVETDKLAKEILKNPKYDGATILICWSHEHIPPLARALGAFAPEKWENDIFDQVYFLTYKGSTKPQFSIILQKLMFGDRASFTEQPLASLSVN